MGDDRSLLGELVVDDHKQPLGVEGGPAEEEREDYSSWRQKKKLKIHMSENLIFLMKSQRKCDINTEFS